MTPVRLLSTRPEGSSGLTTYLSIDLDTDGVKAMASPTTAGKGCDPLYDNAGGDGVVESPPPQPASQDRPRSTPTARIVIVSLLRLLIAHATPWACRRICSRSGGTGARPPVNRSPAGSG